jgi:glutathione S-transferase
MRSRCACTPRTRASAPASTRINTQLAGDLAYGLAYPQLFDGHKRPNGDAQHATLQRARERTRQWLRVMNEHFLGPGHNHLAGDTLTIADYHASSYIKLAEVIRSDLAAHPNVQHWYRRMQALPSWVAVNEVIDGFAASLRGLPLAGA